VAANVQARQLEDMVSLLQQLGQAGQVVSDQGLRDEIRKQLAFPKETRDGLVAVRGETIDMGAPGGQEIGGKGAMPIAGVGEPKPGQQQMREATLYHVLPDDRRIQGLQAGDDFRLDRPVEFREAERDWDGFLDAQAAGPVLVLKSTWSSNQWLKGRFRVQRKDPSGDLIAEHLSEVT